MDDPEFCEALLEEFSRHDGMESVAAPTALAGVKAAQEDRFDLIIMDVGLPDLDGREATRLLRRKGVRVPIIALSGQDSDADIILALDAGAVDYIAKPCRFPVLLARIKAHLRQHDTSDDVVLTVGPYSFRPAAKLLTDPPSRKIRLTDKETAILKYLCLAEDRVVPRQVLLNALWGRQCAETSHTLETHVHRLRRKIEPAPPSPQLLVTEAGGYRLVANHGQAAAKPQKSRKERVNSPGDGAI